METTRVLENGTLNKGWRDAIGRAAADEGARDLVFSGDCPELSQGFHLRFRFRQVQVSIEPDILWNGGFHKGIETFEADLAQHGAYFVFVRANVAAREGIRIDFFTTPLHGSRLRKANRASSRAQVGAIDLNRPNGPVNRPAYHVASYNSTPRLFNKARSSARC